MKKENLQPTPQNTKDHKRVLQAIICQKNGQPRRNGQSPNTESGRNRKYKQFSNEIESVIRKTPNKQKYRTRWLHR